MPTDRYYFDEGTLTIEINGTSLTAAHVRNVTITPAADHNRFYGPDSIKRQEVKRSNFRVNVELTLGEFNEDLVQYWLQGDASTTSTTINDDNNVAEFTVTAEQNMTDHTNTSGDESLKAVVSNVDFPEMPAIDGTENEYMDRPLTGEGDDVTFTKEVVA